MSRKVSVLAIVLLTLAMLVTSCAPATPAPVPTNTPAPVAPTAAPTKAPEKVEPVTIKWVEWWDPEYGEETMDKLIAGFEAEHPNIKVERVSVPWNNMYDALLTNAQSDVAEYDLLGMEFMWVVGLDKIGGVEPLDEYVKNAPKEWQDARADGSEVYWQGKLQELYWYMMPFQFAYNMDIFEEAGLEPPKSWDEFAEDVCALRDEKTDRYGFSMPLGSNYTAHWLFVPRLIQLGGRELDENGYAAFNSPEGVAALEWWKDLLDTGCVVPGSYTEQGAQAREFFATGKVAMTFDGPFIGTIAKQTNPDIRVAFAPAWRDKTGGYLVGGSGLAIAANSKHKEEAWALMQYLLSEDVSLMMTEATSIPFATKAAFASLKDSDDPILKEIPALMNQDLEHNFIYEPLPDVGHLWDVLRENMVEYFSGKKTAQEALDDTVKIWNEKIEETK